MATAAARPSGPTSPDPRERILAATYACVARVGISKTTVEDVAREAGLGRATLYRHFPGGRDQLLRDAIAWETGRFFLRLAEQVADAPDLQAVLCEALFYAHREITDHAVLRKLLETEPDRLLPTLTVEVDRLLAPISLFLRPYLAGAPLRPGVSADEAAEYVARMVLSHIHAQGRWDLTDKAQVAELVRTEILGGVLQG